MAEAIERLLQQIYDIHDIGCNQVYGHELKLPYSFHLKAVVAQIRKYVPNRNGYLVVAGAGHDLIEDARVTYNDLVTMFGENVADIIYCCTEEKGRNRNERHSDKFFIELAYNRDAVLVKLCDIMANVIFSKLVGSSMFEKYQKEFPRLESHLYREGEYDKIWESLKNELEII